MALHFSAGATRTYNTAGNTTLRAQWKQTGTLALSYQTHVQTIGWQKKVSLNTNGKSLKDVKGPMSGTSGRALRLEAITIELTGDLKKHYDIYYRVHAQKVGWMGWAKNGEQAGTAGHAYRLEGIQILLVPKAGGKAPGNLYKGITTPAGTPKFIRK
ncbi:MAG: hypothetical protein FWD27_09440 [Coriobacteriia bacterium]|nr:hypothetical protein [Coriobacteriia bacterium]